MITLDTCIYLTQALTCLLFFIGGLLTGILLLNYYRAKTNKKLFAYLRTLKAQQILDFIDVMEKK
jgi:hypothetical protein